MTADLLTETVQPEGVRVFGDSTFVVADSAERDSATAAWRTVHWDTVRAWRVERTIGGQSAVAWVDGEGRPVEWGFPFGVTFRRGAFEVLVTDHRRRRREGMLPVPSAVAGARRLASGGFADHTGDSVVVVLSRVDGPAWPNASVAFAGGRQRVAGDTVVIRRDSGAPTPEDSVRLRNTGRVNAAIPTGLQDGLAEAVKRYAGVRDTLTALVQWVARDVLLDTSRAAPSLPGSSLLARRSSPEGKARLLAALVELAGIPARIVSGVLVTDPSLPAHTWVEAWRGGWVAVDPVFGHAPASAALLRTLEGPARPLVLVPRVGALRATVVTPQGARR